ncbi:hypothetical protein DRP77_05670 [Candidatus Poribacteria bacterium]|nr:MAG: hypothetical protein DRP77_05670 [Candidatus Poribacteria bacterium]
MSVEGVELFARLAEILNSQQDLNRALEAVCEEIGEAFDVPAVAIYLLDPAREGLVIRAAYGLPTDLLRQHPFLPLPFLDRAHRLSRIIGVLSDLDLKGSPYEGMRSAVTAEIIREGKLIGVILLPLEETPPFSDEELQALEGVANQVALAVDYFQLREQLREGLIKAREEERRRIARELHDQIGQTLTGIKLMLESKARESADESLREIKELISGLISRLRNLLSDLQPSALAKKGLLTALKSYFKRYSDQTGVRVVFSQRGLRRRLPAEVKIAVYRIVQEALTNVARHAGVNEARVEIRAEGDKISLKVEDEGKGFDPDAVLRSGTAYGLAGMRDRATAIGGWLRVDSAPGRGTRVIAEIPLRPWISISTDKANRTHTDRQL